MEEIKLDHLLIGSMISATKTEGFNTDTNWYSWYENGKINDNASPATAAEHWNRWNDDINIMTTTGIKTLRIGLEWARIEPSRGNFDEDTLYRYKLELQYLNRMGIKPVVTLWHFNNPIWFEKLGGFTSYDSDVIFAEYVTFVVKRLGEYVDSWIIFEEPFTYLNNAFIKGIYPPGIKSKSGFKKAADSIIRCHINIYSLIHHFYPKTRVSSSIRFGNNDKNGHHFNDFVDSIFLGKFNLHYNGYKKGRFYDFIALSYDYEDKTDLKELCIKINSKYDSKIYISDGIYDNDDSLRPSYIYDHLKDISELSFVERYYYDSFLDGFEFEYGYTRRKGLIHVDFNTQKRIFKKSALFLYEILKDNVISEEIFRKYIN